MSNLSNQVANRPAQMSPQEASLKNLIVQMTPAIKRALPNVGMTADRFSRIAITAIQQTPKLAQTTQQSFIAALIQSASLGMEPNTPLQQAFLIPYGSVTQFQLGYQGILELARRTGLYKNIYAMEVYEEDTLERTYGMDPTLVHKPSDDVKPGEKPVGYYGVYTLKDGGGFFLYWTRERMEAFGKKYSKSYKSGPWQTAFDEMAKKTMIKQVLKDAPKSSEFASTLAKDSSVLAFDETTEKVVKDITQTSTEEDDTQPETPAVDPKIAKQAEDYFAGQDDGAADAEPTE